MRIVHDLDREMIIGDYYIVPCTKAFADECVRTGGLCHWARDVNGLATVDEGTV